MKYYAIQIDHDVAGLSRREWCDYERHFVVNDVTDDDLRLRFDLDTHKPLCPMLRSDLILGKAFCLWELLSGELVIKPSCDGRRPVSLMETSSSRAASNYYPECLARANRVLDLYNDYRAKRLYSVSLFAMNDWSVSPEGSLLSVSTGHLWSQRAEISQSSFDLLQEHIGYMELRDRSYYKVFIRAPENCQAIVDAITEGSGVNYEQC